MRAVVVACVLVAACGDAKAPSGGKAEVEQPVERDAPAKPAPAADVIAKADTKAEAPTDATPPDATPDAKPGADAKPDAKGDVPSGGADAIGVAECDAYITKYSKCIETGVPAEIRDLMKEAIEHSREAWKKAAAGSGKGDLPSSCKGALAAAKSATAKYGCTW